MGTTYLFIEIVVRVGTTYLSIEIETKSHHNVLKRGAEERDCVFRVKKTRIYVYLQLKRNTSSTRVVNTRP